MLVWHIPISRTLIIIDLFPQPHSYLTHLPIYRPSHSNIFYNSSINTRMSFANISIHGILNTLGWPHNIDPYVLMNTLNRIATFLSALIQLSIPIPECAFQSLHPPPIPCSDSSPHIPIPAWRHYNRCPAPTCSDVPKHRLSARDSYDRTIGGRITGRRDGRERRGGVGGGGVKSVMSSNVKTFQCLSDCYCIYSFYLKNVF